MKTHTNVANVSTKARKPVTLKTTAPAPSLMESTNQPKFVTADVYFALNDADRAVLADQPGMIALCEAEARALQQRGDSRDGLIRRHSNIMADAREVAARDEFRACQLLSGAEHPVTRWKEGAWFAAVESDTVIYGRILEALRDGSYPDLLVRYEFNRKGITVCNGISLACALEDDEVAEASRRGWPRDLPGLIALLGVRWQRRALVGW